MLPTSQAQINNPQDFQKWTKMYAITVSDSKELNPTQAAYPQSLIVAQLKEIAELPTADFLSWAGALQKKLDAVDETLSSILENKTYKTNVRHAINQIRIDLQKYKQLADANAEVCYEKTNVITTVSFQVLNTHPPQVAISIKGNEQVWRVSRKAFREHYSTTGIEPDGTYNFNSTELRKLNDLTHKKSVLHIETAPEESLLGDESKIDTNSNEFKGDASQYISNALKTSYDSALQELEKYYEKLLVKPIWLTNLRRDSTQFFIEQNPKQKKIIRNAIDQNFIYGWLDIKTHRSYGQLIFINLLLCAIGIGIVGIGIKSIMAAYKAHRAKKAGKPANLTVNDFLLFSTNSKQQALKKADDAWKKITTQIDNIPSIDNKF